MAELWRPLRGAPRALLVSNYIVNGTGQSTVRGMEQPGREAPLGVEPTRVVRMENSRIKTRTHGARGGTGGASG